MAAPADRPIPRIRSIQCNHCGAPLALRGGHKVRSLNCEYCGAVMDVRQDYAVLARFVNQEKPVAPFEIGMKGKIHDVEFTIIGIVGWITEGQRWVDYMLYSATRGYAWLSYGKGHTTFERRVRDLPDANLMQLRHRLSSRFQVNGRQYKVFDSYQAKIEYVAGELTWVASQGDSSFIVEGIAPPYQFSQEKTQGETEFYLSEYIEPATLIDSFGATENIYPAQGIHPAQPFRKPLIKALSKAAKPFALAALVAFLVLNFFFTGSTRMVSSLSVADIHSGTKTHFAFPVKKAGSMVELRLSSNMVQAYAQYRSVLVNDKNQQVKLVKDLNKLPGQRHGGEWVDANYGMRSSFRAPAAGSWYLQVRKGEAAMGSTRKPADFQLTLKVREGRITSRYMLWLLVLTGISAMLYPVWRFQFENKRWKDTHGDD